MEVFLDSCGRRRAKPLLLLYLFVVNAAANCPKPQATGNTVLTNEALLMNNFPEGSDVTFECANGYVRESGSGITTCTGGDWGEPDLICKKKDCGPPKPQPNMSFNTSAGTLFGDVVRVVCDKGYQLSGSSYKQCYATGWTGRARCSNQHGHRLGTENVYKKGENLFKSGHVESWSVLSDGRRLYDVSVTDFVVTCDAPGKVAHGKSLWDSEGDPKYGDVIHYVCNEGYTLVGKDNIVCGETGEYDSQPPECEGVTTEARITTKTVTPASTTPAPGSTSTDSSATPVAHRDKTITTSAAPNVSLSARGGRGILTPEDEATTASVTSTTSFQDWHDGAVDTNKDVGYTPVIVSVICVSLAVCIVALFTHKYLLKRKGSYDTREDLKPELLQFQNL